MFCMKCKISIQNNPNQNQFLYDMAMIIPIWIFYDIQQCKILMLIDTKPQQTQNLSAIFEWLDFTIPIILPSEDFGQMKYMYFLLW